MGVLREFSKRPMVLFWSFIRVEGGWVVNLKKVSKKYLHPGIFVAFRDFRTMKLTHWALNAMRIENLTGLALRLLGL